jgi:hypothetical protein
MLKKEAPKWNGTEVVQVLQVLLGSLVVSRNLVLGRFLTGRKKV